MDSRRDFLKKAALLTGSAGMLNVIPMSIQKAMAINADPGSTFYDAEHVVFLMQENRSFDHMFGTLKGVRGFNDPRTIRLPNKNKVWLQEDGKGHTYAPFHVDINKTKITWQGGLAHSWPDQVAARNKGHYDRWVPVKSSMCLGYYKRDDIPFYYALADAFTVCDHSFCSSLTGTTPNRLFFWTGTIRPEQTGASIAVVNNSQAESQDNVFVDWETFPELLEKHQVSWKVYQNELWTPKLEGEGVDDWLGNYGDNPLEYVKRHQVKLSAYFRKNGDHTSTPKLSAQEVQAKYEKLSEQEKNLIDKAFTTNTKAPVNYLELETYHFTDDQGTPQSLDIPKGDIFYEFRKDVDQGTLPTVSWLVAPQRFSDHTSSPLYGTWYVSEALDILTKNPEVWKKTIFILTYDENDGYFDHLAPFTAPNPKDTASGKAGSGIDTDVEFERKAGSPIGLGYRVPFVVASPWTKGGYVNSQIFDHTSSLQFLEKFLSKKKGKNIKSNTISSWRRAVCGDLTSVFRPYNEALPVPEPLKKEAVIQGIQNAKNKPPQVKPSPLSSEDVLAINTFPAFSPQSSSFMPRQETGTKPACPLPYRLYSECRLNAEKTAALFSFEAGKALFGAKNENAGAAFILYTANHKTEGPTKPRSYALNAGQALSDELSLEHFKDGHYDCSVQGPNGFFRQFKGTAQDPALNISCQYATLSRINKKLSGNILVLIENTGTKPLALEVKAGVYAHKVPARLDLAPKEKKSLELDLSKSGGWYDLEIQLHKGALYSRHYAGHVETEEVSVTDPYMGGTL
ncbi:phosphocholine-specific phospholipase C [Pedobacter nutrimenti]|jgi:phospholipase C|uniref:phospholipase C n=1 Tax=Pedobacter nutrimenti TaxID=1241337 RepID=A0A318ULP2_9SPHI|nr:phospholipase C, phosphocholine-specific [Pedobacter nutrimenti]PYF75988.1 phospholipase C [Pedobacter nutrimenti]